MMLTYDLNQFLFPSGGGVTETHPKGPDGSDVKPNFIF